MKCATVTKATVVTTLTILLVLNENINYTNAFSLSNANNVKNGRPNISAISASSSNDDVPSTRRNFFSASSSAALGLAGIAIHSAAFPESALASGGATAGKYTYVSLLI